MLVDIESDKIKTAFSDKSAGKEQLFDERHLWQNIKCNNQLAFSVLYNRYTERLYNYGMHQCHDRELVTDCLQELFTSIWMKRNELSDVVSVKSYLFKSFRNLILKKLNWRKKFLLSIDVSDARSFEITLPVEQMIELDELEAERNTKIKKCILGLTKRQREAVFLKFYNDLNYTEIATIMELQIDSVYNIMSRALDVVRHQLKR